MPVKISSKHYLSCLDLVTKETKETKTIDVGMNKISGRARRKSGKNDKKDSKLGLCVAVGDPDITKVVHYVGSISIEGEVGKPLLVLDDKHKTLASSVELIAGRQGSLGDTCLEPLCKIIDGWAYFVAEGVRSLVKYNCKNYIQTLSKLAKETIFESGVNSFDSYRNRVWFMTNLNTIHCGSRVKSIPQFGTQVDQKLSFGHLVCQGSNVCLAILRKVGVMLLTNRPNDCLAFYLFNLSKSEPLDTQELQEKNIIGYSSNLASVQAGRKYQTLVYWDEYSFHCVITHRNKLHIIPSLFKADQVGGPHAIHDNTRRSRKDKKEKKMRVPDYYRPGCLYVNPRTKSLRVWIKSYYFLTFSCGCETMSECSCTQSEEDVYDIEYIAYSFPLKG